ncbi:hypothetical protein [Sphingomonas sp. BK235]|uniref:hypothetical protein n=1 Tax=Sphingomonas sp. BK235 TaxID=2512131 RepID=UPI0014047919|nr:hypothetical protein [Sphingomonas sp. BK235]
MTVHRIWRVFEGGRLSQILLWGDWIIPGDLIIGDLSKSLALSTFHEKVAQGVVEGVDSRSIPDISTVLERQTTDDLKRSAVVESYAAVECAARKAVSVENNPVIDECTVDVFHSKAPVVVGNSTVAEAGDASSVPGGGRP